MAAASQPTNAVLVAAWLTLTAAYSLTATWGVDGQTSDSLATALPAWSLVERGSLELSGYERTYAWIFETPHGFFSNRAPGLVATTAMGYILAAPFVDEFVVWPATLMAVVTTSGAVTVLAVVVRRYSPSVALPTFLLVGMGTAMWGVAADQIWPHGPAALGVAVAVWSIASGRLNWAGVAFALAILIRPPVAVLAGIVGLGLWITKRSPRPAFAIGVPSMIGGFLFLLYGMVLFGSWSPLAVYSEAGGLGSPDTMADWTTNILLVFSSPSHGLLVWSSWALIALVGLPRAWPRLPDWARWLPLAALLYLMVHVGINRVSGGLPYNYRYPLEAVALAAPVLMHSIRDLSRTPVFRMVLIGAGAASVFLQGAFVLISECTGVGTPEVTCGLFGL